MLHKAALGKTKGREAQPLKEPIMQVTPARSYRCTYHPRDAYGGTQLSESGVLPVIQVKAGSAEHAQRAAAAITGCAIESVERVEDAEVAA